MRDGHTYQNRTNFGIRAWDLMFPCAPCLPDASNTLQCSKMRRKSAGPRAWIRIAVVSYLGTSALPDEKTLASVVLLLNARLPSAFSKLWLKYSSPVDNYTSYSTRLCRLQNELDSAYNSIMPPLHFACTSHLHEIVRSARNA